MLSRFAFIVKAPGYSPTEHAAELASKDFSTHIVGVATFPSAVEAAKVLVANGVQLIELCGGFSEDEARDLRLQIADSVPVGVVTYTTEQAEELARLFG
jgi:DNA-binding LacI/PurR family transcriptional regulator